MEGYVAKYMREQRLLNSLLISVFIVTLLFALLWNIVIWIAPVGEAESDFTDAGKTTTSSIKQEQKVRLMHRQQKAKPSQSFTFQAQAISEISAPDVNIETKSLNPAIALSPMGDLGDVSVKVDMSVLGRAFDSNFMGVQSTANKILFIIDYSASMKDRKSVV